MSAATDTDDAYLSPPVQRAAALLRHIGGGDRVANMSRTARTLGINRTTLLRLLRTLEAEGFIEADARGGWCIGLGLIGLASQALASQDVVQVAMPVAERLAGTLGLSAHLAVLDGRDIVFVVRRAPNSALVSNISVGSRLPAHATNLGRIIMAHLPPAQVERMYRGQAMQAVTKQTPVTLTALRRRLDQDRALGLAWSDGFVEPGLASVAAPVFDATGLPVAALNVSGRAEGFRRSRTARGDRHGAPRSRGGDFATPRLVPALFRGRLNPLSAYGGEGRGEVVERQASACQPNPHLPRPLRPEGRRGVDQEGSVAMDLGLSGRVAVVTGGSSGIGLADCAAAAREGARVAICGRDAERLEKAARRSCER